MKNKIISTVILSFALLISINTHAKDNTITKSITNIGADKKQEKSILHKISNDFIELLIKKDEKKAYDFLDPVLKKKYSYPEYLELNNKIQSVFGKITGYNKKGMLVHLTGLKMVGSKLEKTKETSIDIWYNVRTYRFQNGSIRLKISFKNESKNEKIIGYSFSFTKQIIPIQPKENRTIKLFPILERK